MKNESNVLAQIQAALPGLSKSDIKIAEVVLSDPEAATRASIAHLAQRAGVSEPSVNRFCKRLGASGYPDFKIWLARSLVAGVRYMSQVVDPDDSIDTYPVKLVDNTINALMLARENLPQEAIAQTVEQLNSAQRIYFFGVGTSAAVAWRASTSPKRDSAEAYLAGRKKCSANQQACLENHSLRTYIMPTDDSLNSSGLISGLNEKIAGKIIRPAVNATAVSVSATSFAEVGTSARLSI